MCAGRHSVASRFISVSDILALASISVRPYRYRMPMILLRPTDETFEQLGQVLSEWKARESKKPEEQRKEWTRTSVALALLTKGLREVTRPRK